MSTDQLSWHRSAVGGFTVGIGFYLLCLAIALTMGQLMPWGGPCTMGLPFAALLLGPAVGMSWGLALVGLIILQRAGRFSYGCLGAHALVLAAVYSLRLLL